MRLQSDSITILYLYNPFDPSQKEFYPSSHNHRLTELHFCLAETSTNLDGGDPAVLPMSKPFRTFTQLSRPLSRPQAFTYYRPQIRNRHSLIQQHGLVRIQPVRFRAPPFFSRFRGLVRYLLLVNLSVAGLISVAWYFGMIEIRLEDIEDKDGKVADLQVQTSGGSKLGDKTAQQEGGEEQEETVDVPEIMPEDAIFIPLGFTRQLPRTFYKGSDPEWQSFREFRKDPDREKAVRRMFSLLPVEISLGELMAFRGINYFRWISLLKDQIHTKKTRYTFDDQKGLAGCHYP